MKLFIGNIDDLHRQGAIIISEGISAHWNELGFQMITSLEQGDDPLSVGRQTGQEIIKKLQQMNQENSHLSSQLQDLRYSWYALKNQPSEENEHLKNNLQEINTTLANTQTELTYAKNRIKLLESQQLEYLGEIKRLEDVLKDLNRLAAGQHHQLVELLGKDYSPTNYNHKYIGSKLGVDNCGHTVQE
ncbi:MAG: hypothetical protein JEZ06_11840 [Anaerolineaceae bacterium]|nr:hypothetical protein [Anaerolineaceae bacterium]